MVGLMKYCISISVYIFWLYERHKKKLYKMPITEKDFSLYEQSPRTFLYKAKKYQS